MSCILFCISIQMLNCSIVQQCAVQLLCRQWCLRQKCVTHHTRTRPALSFLFFYCIVPFIFSHTATTVGMGRVTLKINHLISKNTRACQIFERDTFQKKKLECDVNLIQIRPITSKEFILRFTDDNFLIKLSRLKIGPTARGEIESFCPARD